MPQWALVSRGQGTQPAMCTSYEPAGHAPSWTAPVCVVPSNPRGGRITMGWAFGSSGPFLHAPTQAVIMQAALATHVEPAFLQGRRDPRPARRRVVLRSWRRLVVKCAQKARVVDRTTLTPPRDRRPSGDDSRLRSRDTAWRVRGTRPGRLPVDPRPYHFLQECHRCVVARPSLPPTGWRRDVSL